MQTKLNPYLNFKDNAREAMEFYKSVFGGKLDINTFKDYNASPDPSMDNNVMHAALETDNGMSLMAADTPPGMDYNGSHGFGLSLSGNNEAELRGYFDKLAEGGTITQPLDKQVWGDVFGMVTDKFGINWLVNITGTAG